MSPFDVFIRRTWYFRFAQFLLAVIIFCYAALTPSPQLFGQHSDSTMHFTGNVLLFLSAWLAFWPRVSVLKLLLCLMPFSGAIEFAQYFSPGRVVDVSDLGANMAGLSVGACLALVLQGVIKYFWRVK